MKPFDTPTDTNELADTTDDHEVDNHDNGDEEEEDGVGDINSGSASGNDENDEGKGDRKDDDGSFEALGTDARKELLEGTAVARTMLNKVRNHSFFHSIGHLTPHQVRKLSFAIIHSTTIALPAWRKACAANGLPIRLIPRDVRTRWNSVYDMLKMAIKYRAAIDDITANKALKLRKYELDDEDWVIVSDLIRVLRV
jgi:hypothetical protein